MAYERGLHEVGDGVWAYLQPDGGWGWSNAGLVTGDDDASLLVDTLFDLRLTAEMLEAMRRTTPAAEHIGTVVNTHANGDHCYGNALLADSEIISSARSAEEMAELPAETMAAMMRAAPSLGPAGEFLARIFAPFSFDGGAAHLALEDLRRPARPAGRRPSGVVGGGGPRGHRRRHRRAPPRRRHRLHRGHPVPRRPPDRVGRAGGQFGSRPASASWHCSRPWWCPDTGRWRPSPPSPTRRGTSSSSLPRRGFASTAACRPWKRRATSTWGRTPAGANGSAVVANIHALYRDFGADGPNDAMTLMGEMAALAR